MLIADAGSTWCKVFDTKSRKLRIIPTVEMVRKDMGFDVATGHAAKNRAKVYENELIALTEGGKAMIGKKSFTLVDVGARDLKLVVYRAGRLANLNWSAGCASATGATIEMLGRFYGIDFNKLPMTDKHVPVTCGTLSLERVMDSISRGIDPETCVSEFVHGIARNVFRFAKEPDALYLSGGFCGNKAFVKYIKRYCRLHLLGRMVQIRGLLGPVKIQDGIRPPV